ncbi:MAG: GtrA family protein [Proteobacteria bacterium]|nr:MAG: GtrA family protein [Pseudomonadota bacterium]
MPAPEKTSQFFRFAAVGAVGFFVDLGVILLLVQGAGVDPYLARAFAVFAAMLFTWVMNRTYTFTVENSTRLKRELLLYFAVNMGGSMINYAVYSAFLWTVGGRLPLALVISVGLGSLAGLTWNFSMSRRLIYPSGQTAKPRL